MKKNCTDIVITIAILTFFFLLFEISLFLQCNQNYFTNYTAISERIVLPSSILPGMFYFFIAQLLTHLLFAALVAVISYSFIEYFELKNTIFVVILIWFVCMVTVLLANQLYFPNSNFSNLISFFLNERFSKIFFSLSLSFCVLSMLPLLILCSRQITKTKLFFLFFTIVAVVLYSYLLTGKDKQDKTVQTLPNVILIGIDSLRRDFVHDTHFLKTYLQQSTNFTQSYTPIARTFSAWMSILTGQYPKESGFRTNLMTVPGFKATSLLPSILRNKGYKTIYASDEVRFSNIDKTMGFDQIISPPIGVNDFLLGTFNDFPLSNLIINTKLGLILFPHSYANRAVYFTYRPETFIERLKSEWVSTQQPVFFSIHFCLPHYPYLDAETSNQKFDLLQRYENSITQVDKQLAHFFKFLTARGLLNHAIVVVFSDHGEALAFAGDRITAAGNYLPVDSPYPNFYPPSMQDEGVDQSTGHGTDVLSLSQYQTLLAFRLYGGATNKAEVKETVSLIDIKPTLLGLLSIVDDSGSGLSLAPFILAQETKKFPKRHLLLESDYSPQSIRTVYPEIRTVLMEAIDMFEVKPATTRLTIKQDMLERIIKSKQFADLYGHWLVALYPQPDQTYQPILINLKTKKWTTDFTTSFARHSPAYLMIDKIKSFYGLKTKKATKNNFLSHRPTKAQSTDLPFLSIT